MAYVRGVEDTLRGETIGGKELGIVYKAVFRISLDNSIFATRIFSRRSSIRPFASASRFIIQSLCPQNSWLSTTIETSNSDINV